MLDGKFYIATSFNGNGWSCTTTDPALMPARALRIGTYFRDDTMAGFMNAHPDIPIVLADVNSFSADQLAQSMVSGNDAADIYSLSLSYGSFDQLRQKGYCVDLSSSEVLLNAVKQIESRLHRQLLSGWQALRLPRIRQRYQFWLQPLCAGKDWSDRGRSAQDLSGIH